LPPDIAHLVNPADPKVRPVDGKCPGCYSVIPVECIDRGIDAGVKHAHRNGAVGHWFSPDFESGVLTYSFCLNTKLILVDRQYFIIGQQVHGEFIQLA